MDEAEEQTQDDLLDDSLLIDDLNDADDSEVVMKSIEGSELNKSIKTSKDLRMSKEFKIGAAEQYKKMK